MTSSGELLLRELTSLYFNYSKQGIGAVYNTRPEWLLNLELDIYYPNYSIAFEFQGEQHFGLCEFNDNSFEQLKKQVFYDRHKKELCEENGIKLFQVGTFELTPLHFYRMMDKSGLSKLVSIHHETFIRRISKEKELDILNKRNLINESYRSFNNGRKIMSMKNPGARQGYLDNLLKMNPGKNRFMRPSF